MNPINWFRGKRKDAAKKDFVQIKIFDLPNIGVGCNPIICVNNGIFIEDIAKELRAVLEKAFPGKTSTEYINLLWTPQEQETEFGKLLVFKRQPSPLVVIEDKVMHAGNIEVEQIVIDVGKFL